MFNFIKKQQIPKWRYHFILPTKYGTSSSTSSLTFSVVSVFNCSDSNSCEMVYHCDFSFVGVFVYSGHVWVLCHIHCCKLFSQSGGCLFISIMVSFNGHKFLVSIKSNLSTFSFMVSAYCILRNIYIHQGLKDILLCFLIEAL